MTRCLSVHGTRPCSCLSRCRPPVCRRRNQLPVAIKIETNRNSNQDGAWLRYQSACSNGILIRNMIPLLDSISRGLLLVFCLKIFTSGILLSNLHGSYDCPDYSFLLIENMAGSRRLWTGKSTETDRVANTNTQSYPQETPVSISSYPPPGVRG